MPRVVDALWMRRAACTVWPELPWTTDAAHVSPWDAATMRDICHGCPVQPECAATAQGSSVTGGWWAGADRDPDATPVPAPSWVPGRGGCVQGVLPLALDGAA